MPTRTLPLAAALLATFTSVFAVPSLSAVFRIDNPSPAAKAEFGTGIAGLGDQNGDGVPDFAVGVPGADRVASPVCRATSQRTDSVMATLHRIPR
jgi:hypothetical protein